MAYRELRKGRKRYRQVISSFENSEISTSHFFIRELRDIDKYTFIRELWVIDKPKSIRELWVIDKSKFTRELRVVDKPSQPWGFRDIDKPKCLSRCRVIYKLIGVLEVKKISKYKIAEQFNIQGYKSTNNSHSWIDKSTKAAWETCKINVKIIWQRRINS